MITRTSRGHGHDESIDRAIASRPRKPAPTSRAHSKMELQRPSRMEGAARTAADFASAPRLLNGWNMRTRSWIIAGVIGVTGTAGLGVALGRVTGSSCCAQRSSNPASAAATITIHIDGVTCASCTIGIRKALKQLDGVARVTMTETDAVVAYDPTRVDPQRIVAAIDKLGYKARIA